MSNPSVQEEKPSSQQGAGDQAPISQNGNQENAIGENENAVKSDSVVQDQNAGIENREANENGDLVDKDEDDKAPEEEEKPFSYIAMLDAPRAALEPLDLTLDYLKQIADELGLIKLCWPDLSNLVIMSVECRKWFVQLLDQLLFLTLSWDPGNSAPSLLLIT
ncbi:hypothetical protein GWI33_005573 [Rhynchophorus ferrugineus]|uniref:Uncharacterized protein n=1 Tax=Rhynchophorus ferrugineus TaxID=354439 RepID=A0A834IJT6_RHYFE|nr:hypothetical protein GWI33_005573 [Rhynchophorus ferrugineus]